MFSFHLLQAAALGERDESSEAVAESNTLRLIPRRPPTLSPITSHSKLLQNAAFQKVCIELKSESFGCLGIWQFMICSLEGGVHHISLLYPGNSHSLLFHCCLRGLLKIVKL